MEVTARATELDAGGAALAADVAVPANASGIVAFAHGSGSSRRSPRNVAVAERLQREGLATLLFDLLTDAEASDRRLVFDIGLLAERLETAVRWIAADARLGALPVGLFGASTGAAAALVASTRVEGVSAIVSRGGRPDLAGDALELVRAPTLLIVGGADVQVLELNREAEQRLRSDTQLEVVRGATHLFEEPGALERVADLAAAWFADHVRR